MIRILIAIVLTISCNSKNIDDNWKLELTIQGTKVPFNLEISNNSTKAILFNGAEKLDLTVIQKKNNFIIPIQSFDNAIVLKRNDEELKGQWIKYNKKQEYRLNIKGEKGSWNLDVEYPDDFPKKWKISFFSSKGEIKDAILLFSKDNASILTPTGDYRYLRPVFKDKKLNLYGFDGSFSFNFDGFYSNKSFTGTMYSGLDWQQTFKAIPNENFELPDATKVTTINSQSLNICLPNLFKTKTCINTQDNKAKVIQIFGSWCPNCIDETKYISNFRKSNKTEVDFYIVSFERAIDEKNSLKSLKKAKALYNIDYPILIGGLTKNVKVGDIFKGIVNFASFPTTIFVNKNGSIVEIHSGFSGPATGVYFEKFKTKFNNLIKKIQE
jgi:thiol-disulfide isomerase/thioredoxin